MDEFSENTLGVDIIQQHRLYFNDNTQQLTFLQTLSIAIFTIKNFALTPFATTIVQARSFQTIYEDKTYVADICAPKHTLISGPSSLVTFDENNYYAIWLQNCLPQKSALKKETY
jgi:hypothetical protein